MTRVPSLVLAATLALLLGAAPARAESRPGSIDADPSADQLIWTPTGQTHRRGAAFVNVYNFWGIQAGYAPSDSLQFSLDGAYQQGTGLWGMRLKWQLFNGKRLHVALMGGAYYIAEVLPSTAQPGTAAVASGGVAADLCVFDCRVTFAASAEHFSPLARWGSTTAFPLLATRTSLGVGLALTDHLKVLVQGERLKHWDLVSVGAPEDRSPTPDWIVWPTAGIRWFNDRFALELAAGRSAATLGKPALLVGGTVRL